MKLHEAMKKYREEAEISRQEMADYLFMGRYTYNNKEIGKSKVYFWETQMLIKLFKWDLEFVLELEE